MEKAILPKEVAEAIEQMRRSGMNDLHIAASIQDRCLDQAVRIHRWIDNQDDYKTASETVLLALVNGYEVKYTPEQQLRTYYEELKRSEDFMESTNRGSGSQFRQGWLSVESTLRILGIKIEGINA
jgi:hypothetical protein